MEGGQELVDRLHSLCSRVYYSEGRRELLQRLANLRREQELELINQVNEALLALEDEITTVSNMLINRYTRRFPEMVSLNLGSLDYARVVLEIGEASDLTRVDFGKVLPPTLVLAMAMPASTTMGRVLSPEVLADVLMLAKTVIDMYSLRKTFLEFLEGRMARIAPNVTAIVGTTIAAQLLGATGSIEALAKTPAGNIMVIGRQRQKELAGFSLGASNPHAGFIFASDLVAQTPLQYRTQAQRLLANKLALAARLDCQSQSQDGTYGRQLRGEIIAKLEKLIEPAPATRAKPIPPPPIEASKKRGGRRARKQKELYAQTKVRQMANRMEFGKAEEEIIVGDKVVGLGELSGLASGGSLGSQIRAPVLDNKLREHLKKQSQKAYAKFLLPSITTTGGTKMGVTNTNGTVGGATTTVSGTATSMTITPGEGIKLETRQLADPKLGPVTKARYLGGNLSFRLHIQGMMTDLPGQIRSTDGTLLYSHTWKEAEGHPLRAILYLVHGLGEHIKRYGNIAREFSARGVRVHGFDHRGHGETLTLGGNTKKMVRGHIGELEGALGDVDAIMRLDRDIDVPRFLMGHSMGGLIAILYALDEGRAASLAGVIASAPALKPGTPIPRIKLTAGRLAGKICPRLTIDNGLDLNNISRIEVEIQRFLDDPLCHAKISLQTAGSILDMGESVRTAAAEEQASLNIPLLVTHGTADVITSYEASRQFVESLACADKTLKSYSGAYHNLHSDLVMNEVINDYIDWILSRC